MSVATLYDDLRAESPGVPMCRVCGAVDLLNCPTNARRPGSSVLDGGCINCYQRGLLEPDWREAWQQHHCADCGCYLDVHYICEDRSKPWVVQWLTVCVDCFAARTGAHVVWRGDTHLGGVEVVAELPKPAEALAA